MWLFSWPTANRQLRPVWQLSQIRILRGFKWTVDRWSVASFLFSETKVSIDSVTTTDWKNSYSGAVSTEIATTREANSSIRWPLPQCLQSHMEPPRNSQPSAAIRVSSSSRVESCMPNATICSGQLSQVASSTGPSSYCNLAAITLPHNACNHPVGASDVVK